MLGRPGRRDVRPSPAGDGSLRLSAENTRRIRGTPRVSVGRFAVLRSCGEGVPVGVFVPGRMSRPAVRADRVGPSRGARVDPYVRKRPPVSRALAPAASTVGLLSCAGHHPRGDVPTARGGVAAAAARPPGQALACPCCPHAPGPEAHGQRVGPDDASREAVAKDHRVPLTGRGPGAGSGAAAATPPRALNRHRDNAIGSLDHPTSPTAKPGTPHLSVGRSMVIPPQHR